MLSQMKASNIEATITKLVGFGTHVIPVGKRTSYTARGLSKDNVYFGVRAIDKSGNRSPAAFPVLAES